MAFTPYDWNQSIQHRMDFIEERLRDGSPVVGLSIPAGVLLVSIHRAQRKVYEVYDRLMFAGLGQQSDVETMRTAAIDFAHREGFQRSPDDVTVQRLVGSVLSPAIKKAFGDPFTAPFVFRGLFAELGERPDEDQFYTLNFDGEFKGEDRYSVVAGSLAAENQVIDLFQSAAGDALDLNAAVKLGVEAWATARIAARGGDAEDHGTASDVTTTLREALRDGTLEVGFLERKTARESKFRLLRPDELREVTAEYR